ncbi:MAG: hypothetical protein JSS02_01105 [Planctomycetes bacterium]|nr:hypothetical protein [Planctomycetota bacterium]
MSRLTGSQSTDKWLDCGKIAVAAGKNRYCSKLRHGDNAAAKFEPFRIWRFSLAAMLSNSIIAHGLGRFRMWCEKCQTDVAGVTPAASERALCTTCGAELVASAPADPKTPLPRSVFTPPQAFRDARELIARWAQADELERIEVGTPKTRENTLEKPKPAVRYDGSHPVQPVLPETFLESAAQTAVSTAGQSPAPVRSQPTPSSPFSEPDPRAVTEQKILLDGAHLTNAPHFTAVPVALADKSTRWITLAGQVLAYVGVGGLTVGTSLVLLGYFAGPSSHATTGWLIATVGQMLLFLGVVTLISSGMEQTTQEVARRIDLLGDRLGRIEQVAFVGKSQAPSQQEHEPADSTLPS